MAGENVKKYITSSDDWGISEFELEDLSNIVEQFHFVAHHNPSNEGDTPDGEQLPPTNHWSLFLSFSDSSVRVEVAPGELGEPGMVVVESKEYFVTARSTKTVPIDAPEGITVADIFNLIIQRKRDHYIFSPVGEGCRFWLHTLADDFADAKTISPADALRVQSAL